MTEGDDRIMDSFNGVTLGRDIPFDRKKKASGGLYDVPGWEKEPNRCYKLNEIVEQDEKEEAEKRRNGGASSVDDSSMDVFRGRLDGEILPEDGREREAALRRTVDFQKVEIGGLRVELDAKNAKIRLLEAKIKSLEWNKLLSEKVSAKIDSMIEERGIDLDLTSLVEDAIAEMGVTEIVSVEDAKIKSLEAKIKELKVALGQKLDAGDASDTNTVTNPVTKVESDESVTVTKIVTKIESDENDVTKIESDENDVTKVESDESVTKVESDENDVTNSVTKVGCYESVTNPVTKGRPRLGERVMTAAERMRKMRAKAKAEKGETL